MNDGVLKYGASTHQAISNAQSNFVDAQLNGLSLCCTPIELLSNDGQDTVLHTASGFFWLQNGQPHLVTNWHVISGRNPFTGELGPKAFVPTKLAFYGLDITLHGPEVRFARRRWVFELDEDTKDLLSKPPMTDGQPVDIWAAPIAPGTVPGKDPHRAGFSGAPEVSSFVNEHAGMPIVSRAGDDCFILGYPLNNSEGLMPPIWKRGSIASDTNIGVDGRPIFLVDSAVTPAMSGSPIFRRVVSFAANNRDIGAIQEFTHFEFIGVYAGRLQSAKLEATNLGYGWYRILIDRVIASYGYRTPIPLAEAAAQ